jgi:hypothetical protein
MYSHDAGKAFVLQTIKDEQKYCQEVRAMMATPDNPNTSPRDMGA